MTTICSVRWPSLSTPHDGPHTDVEVEVYDPGYPHRLVVRSEPTGDLAYLDVDMHRLWKMNPGLREALCDRVRAIRLVQG